MKNNKAFTLTELIVTISMIILLAVTWSFYGRGHVKIAMLNEGRLFADQIISQEKNHFNNIGSFITMATNTYVTTSPQLFINTKNNKYFKAFNVSYSKPSLTVIVKDKVSNDASYNEVKYTVTYNVETGSTVGMQEEMS